MNKVIEKATAHFRNKVGQQLRKIEVKEWDTTIYFKPTMTLKEQSGIIELTNTGKTVEALVETLIVKARNEDGSKMFLPADRVIMMNEIDPNVLIRVVGEMNMASAEINDLEAVEKN